MSPGLRPGILHADFRSQLPVICSSSVQEFSCSASHPLSPTQTIGQQKNIAHDGLIIWGRLQNTKFKEPMRLAVPFCENARAILNCKLVVKGKCLQRVDVKCVKMLAGTFFHLWVRHFHSFSQFTIWACLKGQCHQKRVWVRPSSL